MQNSHLWGESAGRDASPSAGVWETIVKKKRENVVLTGGEP